MQPHCSNVVVGGLKMGLTDEPQLLPVSAIIGAGRLWGLVVVNSSGLLIAMMLC